MTIEQKVDEILFLLKGSDHSPGLSERLETTEVILNGDARKGSMGLVQKVSIMWRIHLWLIGGVGTILGAFLTWVFHK